MFSAISSVAHCVTIKHTHLPHLTGLACLTVYAMNTVVGFTSLVSFPSFISPSLGNKPGFSLGGHAFPIQIKN